MTAGMLVEQSKLGWSFRNKLSAKKGRCEHSVWQKRFCHVLASIHSYIRTFWTVLFLLSYLTIFRRALPITIKALNRLFPSWLNYTWYANRTTLGI